jgi:hypothetical protein
MARRRASSRSLGRKRLHQARGGEWGWELMLEQWRPDAEEKEPSAPAAEGTNQEKEGWQPMMDCSDYGHISDTPSMEEQGQKE